MEQNPTGQGGEQQPPVQPQQPAQPSAGQQPPQKSSSNTVLIIVAVVVVLGLVMLVGGYFVVRSLKAKVSQKVGQAIGENMLEKAIEKGTGQKADVSTDGNNVSIKTGDGTMAASEEGTAKLPSDFPSDVFVYSDAKISFAISTPANAASGTTASYVVSYSVSQSSADVVAKYKAEMVKNGWTIGTEANYGSVMINFEKGNKEVSVAVGESQDGKAGTAEISVTGSEK